MITLPAFRNYSVCDFMIELTDNYVGAYKIDVAYDVMMLYKIVLNGKDNVFWGVRKCGTGMGYAESEILDFYKKNNMIMLFEFSNLKILNGKVWGDIKMISYTEEYENKWYNEYGEEKSWYNAGDDYDEFYNSVRKITRNFLRDKDD